MKMYRIAYTTDQNRKKIDDTERKMRKLTTDLKNLERDFKKAMRDISDLNIGARRFWQQRTVFNTVERKLERFEKVEKELRKYKNEMDAKIKRLVEQKNRASIQ